MKRAIFISLVTVCILVAGKTAVADTIHVGSAKVLSTMVTQDGTFGGCMARLELDVATAAPNCRAGGWVSFSCTGDFMDKDRAYRMLDTAQMAQALGLRMTVRVNDHQKHNGYCVAQQISTIK